MRAVDCQGLGGSMTRGAVKAGFEIALKLEQSDWATEVVDANRHLLGDFERIDGTDDWEITDAEYVFGCPPCSGFSGLTTVAGAQGMEAPINHCMWDWANYVRDAQPLVAVMESVRLAYTKGLPLMRQLAQRVMAGSGDEWTVYHTLHNSASLGSNQIRPRYFLVMARIPFGFHPFPAEYMGVDKVKTFGEVVRGSSKVAGHVLPRSNPESVRHEWLAKNVEWNEGEQVETPLKRMWDYHGKLLGPWAEFEDRYVNRPLAKGNEPFTAGGFSPRREWWDLAPRVITGGAMRDKIHPRKPRTLTYREVARLMGLDDDWDIEPYRTNTSRHYIFGKAVTVGASEWIARTAADAIAGRPGPYQGEQLGEREYVVDFTHDHKAFYNEKTGEATDSRPAALARAMAQRPSA